MGEQSRKPERRSRLVLNWTIFRGHLVKAEAMHGTEIEFMKTAMEPTISGQFRFRLRTFFVCVAIVSIFVAYGTVYYQISRRGMAEAKNYGLTAFLYVPADEVFASEDLSTHHRIAIVFAPANWIDQLIFGGPPPVVSIMFRLS